MSRDPEPPSGARLHTIDGIACDIVIRQARGGRIVSTFSVVNRVGTRQAIAWSSDILPAGLLSDGDSVRIMGRNESGRPMTVWSVERLGGRA